MERVGRAYLLLKVTYHMRMGAYVLTPPIHYMAISPWDER